MRWCVCYIAALRRLGRAPELDAEPHAAGSMRLELLLAQLCSHRLLGARFLPAIPLELAPASGQLLGFDSVPFAVDKIPMPISVSIELTIKLIRPRHFKKLIICKGRKHTKIIKLIEFRCVTIFEGEEEKPSTVTVWMACNHSLITKPFL